MKVSQNLIPAILDRWQAKGEVTEESRPMLERWLKNSDLPRKDVERLEALAQSQLAQA